MAEDEVDFSKLSIEDRAGHKAWKARLSACEDMVKLFGTIDDEKSPEWNKYTNLVRKLPVDSNAAAQEKGLEATLIFLENSAAAGRLVGEIMSGVVTKCLTGSRAKTRELSTDIIMMCVEIEKYDVVTEELMKGMEQKNPKLVAACITVLTQILREFGPKVLNLKVLVKKIVPLSEDRDKTVREVNKKLTVELFRWLGAGFRPQLATLKPLVMQELETEFEKVGSQKPVQLRYLRSQQAKKEKAAEAEDDAEEVVVDDNADPDVDPYDLIESVDILSKLPKDFYENCESKKWQERKDALAALETLVANPKLEPGDYADLVRVLKRMISKDTNVVVVASAGKCLAGLANGLKKKFAPYAPSCIQAILEKFKEKKPAVLTAMREASDLCFAATTLELIQEDSVGALGNKNPAIKAETALLMARCFSKTSLSLLNDKKFMKPLLTALVANLNESDPVVRDSAAEALGVTLKAIGEKPMTPYLSDLDPIKMAKVKEFADKAVLTMPKPKVVKAASSKPAAQPAAEKAKPGLAGKPPRAQKAGGSAASTGTYRVEKPVNKPVELESPEPAPKVKPGVRGPFKPKTTSPTAKKGVDEPTGLNLPSNNLKAQRALDEMKMKMIRWQFTVPRSEFVELLKELVNLAGFSKHLSNLMFHADFKNHLRALDILTGEFLIDTLPTIQNYDLILKWLSLRFYDTNPSVLIKGLEYSTHTLRVLGEQGFQMSDLEVSSYVPHLLTKIGDGKDIVRTHVHTILRQLHAVTQATKIFSFVIDGLKSKNARARAECLDELTYMISTYTTSICQPSPAVALNSIARQISDRDTAVRNSALNCIVEVYFLTGDKIYKMIGQLNDKDMSLLEERIKRAAKQRENNPPSAPVTAPVTVAAPTGAQRLSNTSAQPPAVNLASGGSVNSGPTLSQFGSASTVGAGSASSCALVIGSSTASGDIPFHPSNGFPAPAASSPSGLGINTFTGNARNEPRGNDILCMDEMSQEGDFVHPMYVNVPTQPEPARTVRKWTCPPEYRVDFEANDNMFGAKDLEPMPPLKLYDTDIEYLKYETPVSLPRRTAEKKPVPPGAPKDVFVPPKACQSIDLTVSQVGTSDLRKVLEAATQVEALLADPAVANVMVTRVDHLLFSVTSQLHRLIPLLQNYQSNNLGDINKVYRALVHLLQTFYKGTFLPLHVGKDILRDLIYHLLLLIVDPNISVLMDPTTLVRNINILVVRVIERSDANATITALIRLLNETLRMTSQPRLLDLTMKCQWKLLKQLNVWMKDKTIVFDIRSFMQEFNSFFRAHPLSSFDTGNETPLKTIKTIFHSLVMNLGPEAFIVAMAGLPELKDTEAEKYMNKLVSKEMARKGSGDISSTHDHDRDTDNGPINNNSNNNVQEFLKSLPDPQNPRRGQDKASVYMKRLDMIRQRGGLTKPSLSDECPRQDSMDSMF